MEKALHIIKFKLLLFLAAGLLFSHHATASVNEDSCWASMLITPDNNDPLLIHFTFAGNVPAGSFQFLGMWDFGDGNLSSDSCPDHQYTQPGTYVVCLSFSICIGGGLSCHDDTCISITIGNISGINDVDGNLHSFYFYPNPVKSFLYIRSDATGELELRLRDATGRQVYNGIVKNDEGIDVSSFAAGMYVVEASDGKTIIQRKLVLEK